MAAPLTAWNDNFAADTIGNKTYIQSSIEALQYPEGAKWRWEHGGLIPGDDPPDGGSGPNPIVVGWHDPRGASLALTDIEIGVTIQFDDSADASGYVNMGLGLPGRGDTVPAYEGFVGLNLQFAIVTSGSTFHDLGTWQMSTYIFTGPEDPDAQFHEFVAVPGSTDQTEANFQLSNPSPMRLRARLTAQGLLFVWAEWTGSAPGTPAFMSMNLQAAPGFDLFINGSPSLVGRLTTAQMAAINAGWSPMLFCDWNNPASKITNWYWRKLGTVVGPPGTIVAGDVEGGAIRGGPVRLAGSEIGGTF